MNSSNPTERQWQVIAGSQQLGVYPESLLAHWISSGRIPAGALLSCGAGWITPSQFLAALGAANGAPNAAPNSTPWPQSPVRAQPAWAAPEARPGIEFPQPGFPGAPPRVPDGGAAASVPLPNPAGAEPWSLEMVANALMAGAPTPPPIPMPAAPAPAPAAPAPAAPALEPRVDDGPPERDQIVVLGRRQSGKTIYLASVYAQLWRALDGLTAKALRGEVHKQLMEVIHVLREGRWPASTLESRQMELELDEAGRKRLMVALDYAGEMFANAFVHERLDIPEVKSLVDHIDRAAAVMLLVDPSIVAGMDHQAAMEDDFGLVQAVQRIRNWPGGDDVPVVLVLTKVDQYQSLLDRFGGPDGFVRHHFPALVRLLKRVAIFQVSAVQVQQGPEGKVVPRKDSAPVNVDNPLRYCLRTIHRAEEKRETERAERERHVLETRLRLDAQRRERRQNIVLALSIGAMVLVGVVVIAIILIKGR